MTCALVSVYGVVGASAAPKRVFKGSTGQDRSIRLTVRSNSIQVKRFKARLSCRDGSVLILDESGFLRTPIKRNGKFRDVQVGKTDEVFIRGRAKRGVVRGKLRVKDKLRGGVRCHSRWIKFRAKPAGRRGGRR